MFEFNTSTCFTSFPGRIWSLFHAWKLEILSRSLVRKGRWDWFSQLWKLSFVSEADRPLLLFVLNTIWSLFNWFLHQQLTVHLSVIRWDIHFFSIFFHSMLFNVTTSLTHSHLLMYKISASRYHKFGRAKQRSHQLISQVSDNDDSDESS